MIIRKLRASFGKLKNDTLVLHDGLNIVYAPNESGKSTWCAFIRTMLYGIDTSERARVKSLPDKQRYAPWSGAPMEGSMELTADHCDITIQRSTKSRSAPMKEFSAVYTGTNTPVEGMTGLNCGELLTGVNREVFRRSAFIEQGAVAVSGSPELEKRIQSIVSSGEEETSYSEADELLTAWQHKRRYRQKGILPALEGKMDEAQRLLDEMGSSVDSVQDLEARLEKSRQECHQLESAVTEARRRQRTDALISLRNGRAIVQQRNDSHDEALAELSRCRDALRRSQFGERASEDLAEEIQADRETLEELEEEPGPGRSVLPAILFSFLAVLTAVLYGITAKLPVIIASGIFCIGAIVFFLRYSRLRQNALRAELKRDQLLKKYRISVADDLDRVLQKHRALEEAVIRAQAEEKRSRDSLARAGLEMHSLEEAAINELDFTGGNSEAARLSRALQAKRQEAAALSEKISSLTGKLSAMGDPMILASSLSSMRDEYETVQAEYDAISLASEMLREADLEIQNRFSPELSRVAARYMSEMTGGRYEDVLIGQDFSAKTRIRDDSVARQAEYLSAGTMDLMYLAVRLAVCELALPDGEPCPLILDDALVNLDEERLRQAMALLKKLALRRQIILFTCRPTSPSAVPLREDAT
ncbi:MAG: AAA family ATPase [Oscillospiraceae bacterium]|nr:AAA family ATPase [Oscillospiraceae bacterium]